MLVTHLPQILVAEKSYGELGFLVTKNKGFLRKDVSSITNEFFLQESNKCFTRKLPTAVMYLKYVTLVVVVVIVSCSMKMHIYPFYYKIIIKVNLFSTLSSFPIN